MPELLPLHCGLTSTPALLQEQKPVTMDAQFAGNTATPPSIIGFRLQIDAAINSFPYMRSSRETEIAHVNLQRAFMWLGFSLKASGSSTPYVNSSNPANATIEAQADHTENNLVPRWQTIDQTQTARVTDFRYYLEQLIQNFKEWKIKIERCGAHYDACLHTSYMALIEAKCWLGWELNRIKKEKEGANFNLTQGPSMSLPL